MLNTSNELLVNLAYFYNGRKTEIGTPNKERGNVFLQCCTESFKVIILCNVNEVLFKEIKSELKDICLWGVSPTVLKNQVYACQNIYDEKET